MQARHYAQALCDLSASKETEEGKLVKNFIETVEQNGHAHMLPAIMRAFERIRMREEKKQTIEVISGKDLSQADVAALLKHEPFKQILSPEHKKVTRKTDKTLVGGAIVRSGTVRIDASYKRALVDLYQTLIT